MSTTFHASPKIRQGTIPSRTRWYNFYAMFSEEFAADALDQLSLSEASVVLDPWLGSGTTSTVAAAKGFRSIGFDVNPAMVAISAGRLLTQIEAQHTASILAGITARTCPAIYNDDPLLYWFHPVTARALRHWNRTIDSLFPRHLHPCQNGFLHTALFDCAKGLAKAYKSRNPTWIKRPSAEFRLRIESSEIRRRFMNLVASRISLCAERPPAYRPQVELASSLALPLADDTVDAVLSSPPYCTRIDYAITTSLELAVLGKDDTELKSLRDKSMGTSTVRGEVGSGRTLYGPECDTFLSRVREHKSKSSATYYFKVFHQYFCDMHSSLSQINRCVRPGGHVVLVVQDSCYKDLHVDLALIVSQMAAALRWQLSERRDFEAKKNMRSVNTKSRKYQQSLSATESALFFQKP